MYASYEDYLLYGGALLSAEEFERAASKACIHIDTITFNRIHGKGGLDKFSAYQQEMIKRAACLQADFEYENADVINTVLQSYGINGVSVSLGNAPGSVNVMGMLFSRDAHAALVNTGLASLSLRFG